MIQNGIFFGLSTIDIIHYIPRFPHQNEKMKSERTLTYAGGPATNASVTFSALGNNATLVTDMGNGPTSQYSKQELSEFGVKVHDYSDQPDRPPVISSILVDLSNGTRTVINSNTDLRRLKKGAVKEVSLETADIVLFDGYYTAQAARFAKKAQALGIITVLDGGSWKEGEEELLPFIDYIICSSDFYPPGCATTNDVFDYLKNYNITNIAITRGGDPIVVDDGESFTQIPVMEITPLDTLGAGDILHGAFCHFIQHNDFITSITRASEVASQSCMSLGTRNWIEQEMFV